MPSPTPESALRAKKKLAALANRAFGLSAVARPRERSEESVVAVEAGAESSVQVLPTDAKRLVLQQLDETQVRGCTKCRLHESRTNTVFGEGSPDAKIFFIGEGPGENEDLQGRPFVGRAGGLLENMIAAMGLRRDEVFIANIVKCRPPGNRAPAPDETLACTPYLLEQIRVVRPQVIVTLGAPAAKFILRDDKLAITRIRGTWKIFEGIKVMPTFHPAYILRQYTPTVRGQVWSDLQQVMDEVGLTKKSRDGAIV